MKTLILLLSLAVCLAGCEPSRENNQAQVPDDTLRVVSDSVRAPTPPVQEVPKSAKALVVGFGEVDMYFHNWPEGLFLDYAGAPFTGDDDDATRFTMTYQASRVGSIQVKPWSHVDNLGLIGDDTEYKMGNLPTHRTLLPDGSVWYSFEIHEGLGWIVSIDKLEARFEEWLRSGFTSSVNEETDSLVTLVSTYFPLQIPRPVQRIGISFRTETYHDGTFPRTKIEMRLTNFASLKTNSTIIADVAGSVENVTDGKPLLQEGEQLILMNFYGGLSRKWILVHAGDKLVLYEESEDEPSMDEEVSRTQRKELLVLPVPPELDFEFVGYYPMGE